MNFIKGMDVSMLQELESEGAKYYLDGQEMDIFDLFKQKGINSIRLRLWNYPYDETGAPYGGGTNDLETTINLAKRLTESGLDFILDFHYSDFWADPKKQVKPKAWTDLTGRDLENAVHDYTLETLKTLKQNGIQPTCVQVGNEITSGFLWGDGHISNLEGMTSLLQAGISAVREFDSTIKIMLHLDYGTDNRLYREWFSSVKKYELDFDLIGMSYYPDWNGSLEVLLANMNDISQRFDKDIVIAETAFCYTTDSLGCNGMIVDEELSKNVPYEPTKEGQKEYLEALLNIIKSVRDNRGVGLIYWEPSWLPIPHVAWAKEAGAKYANDEGELGNSWANQALFDESGNANPALDIFLND